VISAAAALAAAVLGLLNRKKLTEVHLLVNSRLDSALSQIADLKQQRDLKRGDDLRNDGT